LQKPKYLPDKSSTERFKELNLSNLRLKAVCRSVFM